MDLSELSIRRPIFLVCVVLLSLVVGLGAMSRMGVDLFPDVTFPVVTVSTPYPGAGPSEVETLVSKPLEDELSTLSGIKRLSSINKEGISTVVAEFTLETDVKYAEQQIRDRVGSTKRKLPDDIKEPVIRRIDPADQPILILAVNADLPAGELYDLVNERIKPRLEQVNQVGLVEILGGRKREIQVQLDRTKLKGRELSATLVASRLAGAGNDIPSGKKSSGDKETVFRTVGQFKSFEDIRDLVVNFFGNDVPIRIGDVATVTDSLVDETSKAYVNGEKSLFLYAFRQSGANTIKVADALKRAVAKANTDFAADKGKPKITMVRDGSTWIRANVDDVEETIIIGILLAVFTVFLFLANGRSTIITGLALPNSLIGAFILMALSGFTINIMTLLALSLSVGLLIDDAIVVRENIFRHIEMGKSPMDAARQGTAEVKLAVIGTTLAVIAVFGPLGFLSGVVGQFFKQFGLTVCFAMAISLFDALTMAPMLSAYLAGKSHGKPGPKKSYPSSILGTLSYAYDVTIGNVLLAFSNFQDWLEVKYEAFIRLIMRRALIAIGLTLLVTFGCFFLVKFVPKTFLPTQDAGEFTVGFDLPPGTNLEATNEVSMKIDKVIRANKEVMVSALTVGSRDGDPNYSDIYVRLVPSKQRPGINTSQFKERLRGQLKEYAYANPKVKDYDAVGGGQRPFTMNIQGVDQKQIEEIGTRAVARIRKMKGLLDVDINFRSGKPEFQVVPDKSRAQMLGVSTTSIGNELRAQVEGLVAAKYREKGIEYDIRVRMKEDQRDIRAAFPQIYVPNLNNSLIKISNVASPVDATGPSSITRMDRMKYIQVSGDIAPGAGLGDIITEATNIMNKEMNLPEDVKFQFIGQAENFKELGESMIFAVGAGIIFIFLVLASLYESFVTPFTIMLAMPLAICGAFVGLYVGNESLNLFSMIGCIMLIGIACKNSILLVDYANQLVVGGMNRTDAMVTAGKARLRPILMTTMALIAGTVPLAIGLNEASKQRTSMGWAIIGGLISSTLLTLIVVPAAYAYIDRFRVWSLKWMTRIFVAHDANGVDSHGGGMPTPSGAVPAQPHETER
ncbi:efflux RND transporter permease subunit [soil metagenome]